MIIKSESFDINDNFDVVMIYYYQIIIIDGKYNWTDIWF